MRRIALTCLGLLLACSLGAQAQTQQEMNMAAAADYKQADAELNRVYRQLLGQLEGRERNKLISAERAWIKFRDADCEFAALSNEGGSIYPLVHFGALTAKTKIRTEELRGYLEDYGH